MAKTKSPSFILEKKLLTSARDEETLGLRFVYVWRMKIQLAKHARKQLQKHREDRRRRQLLAERERLRSCEDKPSRKRLAQINSELTAIRIEYGLSQYQFKLWVQPLQHRYGRHIDSILSAGRGVHPDLGAFEQRAHNVQVCLHVIDD